MKKVYIVTNTTTNGNYTPSAFEYEADARKWFYELAWEDAMSAWSEEIWEYFADKIKGTASDVLEKIPGWLKKFDEYMTESNSISPIDDAELLEQGKDLIKELNNCMEKNNIPLKLDVWDDIYDIEACIYNLNEMDDSFLDDYSKGNEKEYLEFIAECDEFSGIEIGKSKIYLEYSDGNMNCIELFEVPVLTEY